MEGIIKKIKKGYKKWLVVGIKHCFKKEFGRNQYQNMSEEKSKK